MTSRPQCCLTFSNNDKFPWGRIRKEEGPWRGGEGRQKGETVVLRLTY